MIKVKLENVTKTFGENIAINNISFTCNDGEFFVIFGPSGAGKTTLMNLIAGLEEPSKGFIYFNDRMVNNVEPRYRNVSYAFENYSLYPHLNVYENICFPLKSPLRKDRLSKEKIDLLVNEIVEKLQINDLLDRNINQLSGGQRQRVALARALIREPDLYLLDEAIAHLDAKLKHSTRAILKGFQKQKKVTTIYTTPDQLEALALGDRIAIINQGTLQQLDTPENVLKYPKNTFVARLFGEPSINLFNGKLISREQKMFIDINGVSLLVPEENKNLLYEKYKDSNIIMGIRPNDISIITKNSDIQNNSNIVVGVVKLIEFFGDSFVYLIKFDDLLVKVKSESEIEVRINEKVNLQFNMNKIFIFDKSTEERIWP